MRRPMTFIAAKVFWLFAKPSHLIVLLLVAGVAALWLDRPRIGGALVTLGTAALAALTLLPLGSWLMVPLENRFPQPKAPPPGTVDGVIVLGGAPRLGVTVARGQPTFGGEAERVTSIVELGRRYPGARLVFTGGSGSLFGISTSEAEVVREFLARQRFDVGRVLFEAESRDTYENAIRSKELVGPGSGEQWLLVTSAFHMPRSVGVFRRVGWDRGRLPGRLPYHRPDRAGAGAGLRPRQPPRRPRLRRAGVDRPRRLPPLGPDGRSASEALTRPRSARR
jgi:uncharacterized SAM-binding protein YcdF (DUF218 family)